MASTEGDAPVGASETPLNAPREAEDDTSPQTWPAKEMPCAMCKSNPSKYRCPRCDTATCSLECVNEHKLQLECSGKRDRTAFVSRSEFDERALLSDYHLLEEIERAGDAAKRARPPPSSRELPRFLQRLVAAARERGARLHVQAPKMLRRRSNTTRVEKDGALSWRVEWVWPQGARTALARVTEDTTLQEALRMAVEKAAKGGTGLEGVLDPSTAHVLMRRERTPANAVEYIDMDRNATLAQALRGKDIVEFPTFLVVAPETLGEFTLHVTA